MIMVYHILYDVPRTTLRVTFIDCAYYSLALSSIILFDFSDFSLSVQGSGHTNIYTCTYFYHSCPVNFTFVRVTYI